MKYSSIFNDKLGCSNSSEVFDYLINTLADSITFWNYYVDWDKVLGNVKDIEVDLNTLNYLIGKPNVEEEFKYLLKQQPRLVRLIPILIACRYSNFSILTDYLSGKLMFKYFDFTDSEYLTDSQISDAYEFVKNIGLLELFKNRSIKSIPDYVIGVEVGLDTNARKNRGGTTMEVIIEELLRIICEKNDLDLLTQATSKSIKSTWNIDMEVDITSRRFDFAIKNGNLLYLIETNFYGGGGSKLKATAGEYKTIYDFVTSYRNKFIWITDGLGWTKTRKPLREAFDHLDYILNLKMITEGVLEEILSNNL